MGWVRWAILNYILGYLGLDGDNSPHYWPSNLDKGRVGSLDKVEASITNTIRDFAFVWEE